jgi:acyl-CoA synthetase (AMP-forming)/AMP-acid ligase II
MRLPNCPEFIITWLACQKLGVVNVSTMPMLRARELGYIASDAGTTAAVVGSASAGSSRRHRARPRSSAG